LIATGFYRCDIISDLSEILNKKIGKFNLYSFVDALAVGPSRTMALMMPKLNFDHELGKAEVIQMLHVTWKVWC
jgi:hypothetical protein